MQYAKYGHSVSDVQDATAHFNIEFGFDMAQGGEESIHFGPVPRFHWIRVAGQRAEGVNLLFKGCRNRGSR